MTERNWRVVGLSPENTVITEVNGGPPQDTYGPPSEYVCDYLTRAERGILRQGMTSAGRDRRPR